MRGSVKNEHIWMSVWAATTYWVMDQHYAGAVNYQYLVFALGSSLNKVISWQEFKLEGF